MSVGVIHHGQDGMRRIRVMADGEAVGGKMTDQPLV
jgi:hypothetical protein